MSNLMTLTSDYYKIESSGDMRFLMFFSASILIFFFGLVLLSWICNYTIFSRHYGVPGWKALIPLYNGYIIAQKTFGENKGWTYFLILIPIIGGIYSLYFSYKTFERLNRGLGIFLLSLFVPIIGLPIVAFGSKTKYLGPTEHIF